MLVTKITKFQNQQEGRTATQNSAACPYLLCKLTLGSRGIDVVRLQVFLISQGYLTAGNVTGYYGNLTEAAVKSFQRAKGLAVSGTPATTGYGAVGPKTRIAILDSCKIAQVPSVIILTTNSGERERGGSGGNGEGVAGVGNSGSPTTS